MIQNINIHEDITESLKVLRYLIFEKSEEINRMLLSLSVKTDFDLGSKKKHELISTIDELRSELKKLGEDNEKGRILILDYLSKTQILLKEIQNGDTRREGNARAYADAGRTQEERTPNGPDIIDDYERFHIAPWKNLRQNKFVLKIDAFGDLQLQAALERLEEYGICLIRFSGQTPDENTLKSQFKLIGQVAEHQNDFVGEIKDLKPVSGVEANTGTSAGDLGFHVDGTQHEFHPAILVFQYVVPADVGGNSRFLDLAKVVDDLPDQTREQVLINLSRPDAATFEKKNMRFEGPIFAFPDKHSLACRIRFDTVIKINPKYEGDFDTLIQCVNKSGYELMFKPRRGDIIIFDNWRVMHARDEIYGLVQRHHRRVWLNTLRPEHQAKYFLGIRPLSPAIIARMQES